MKPHDVWILGALTTSQSKAALLCYLPPQILSSILAANTYA